MIALFRSMLCGRKGDIGGGCCSIFSKSASIKDRVSVAVIVGSLQVDGKKSTVN